jgi:hypothetical protein
MAELYYCVDQPTNELSGPFKGPAFCTGPTTRERRPLAYRMHPQGDDIRREEFYRNYCDYLEQCEAETAFTNFLSCKEKMCTEDDLDRDSN